MFLPAFSLLYERSGLLYSPADSELAIGVHASTTRGCFSGNHGLAICLRCIPPAHNHLQDT